MLSQALQHGFLIMLAHVSRDTTKKCLAGGALRHVADIMANQLHRVASVAVEHAVTILRLRRRTVDDGNEVISDDDAVLAFLRGILWDKGLLDNFHCCSFLDIAR